MLGQINHVANACADLERRDLAPTGSHQRGDELPPPTHGERTNGTEDKENEGETWSDTRLVSRHSLIFKNDSLATDSIGVVEWVECRHRCRLHAEESRRMGRVRTELKPYY